MRSGTSERSGTNVAAAAAVARERFCAKRSAQRQRQTKVAFAAPCGTISYTTGTCAVGWSSSSGARPSAPSSEAFHVSPASTRMLPLGMISTSCVCDHGRWPSSGSPVPPARDGSNDQSHRTWPDHAMRKMRVPLVLLHGITIEPSSCRYAKLSGAHVGWAHLLMTLLFTATATVWYSATSSSSRVEDPATAPEDMTTTPSYTDAAAALAATLDDAGSTVGSARTCGSSDSGGKGSRMRAVQHKPIPSINRVRSSIAVGARAVYTKNGADRFMIQTKCVKG